MSRAINALEAPGTTKVAPDSTSRRKALRASGSDTRIGQGDCVIRPFLPAGQPAVELDLIAAGIVDVYRRHQRTRFGCDVLVKVVDRTHLGGPFGIEVAHCVTEGDPHVLESLAVFLDAIGIDSQVEMQHRTDRCRTA